MNVDQEGTATDAHRGRSKLEKSPGRPLTKVCVHIYGSWAGRQKEREGENASCTVW